MTMIGIDPHKRPTPRSRSTTTNRCPTSSNCEPRALRSDRLAQVRPDDHSRVLRLLSKRHRDMARLRNKHCTRLHALLLDLEAGGIGSEITVAKANQLLDRVVIDDDVTRYRVLIFTVER